MPHTGHASRALASWPEPSNSGQFLALPSVFFSLVLSMNCLFSGLDLSALGLGSQDGLPFCICCTEIMECVPQSFSN